MLIVEKSSFCAIPICAHPKPSLASIYHMFFINNLRNIRPLKNGSIARPEERGRQERTLVRDLARTTRTQLEDILQWSY